MRPVVAEAVLGPEAVPLALATPEVGPEARTWAADALHSGERHIADSPAQQARRLETAMQLLRWTDNREKMPMEDDFEEPPSEEPAPEEPPFSVPAEAPEDLEETRDAAPSGEPPKQ